ncbi:MAG: hypothetical protein CMJ96_09005 [Planctomycetes bacterium]|jgi:hypothetical protein|nr:hypothetical protein [Planctomycetota bacterium]MDP6128488.1 hypothetical protein [Planctomycetota bacterium]MDP7246908.1 hypothetical protein [Planctomycetota bacterium]
MTFRNSLIFVCKGEHDQHKRALARARKLNIKRSVALKERVSQLEGDVGYLALLLGSLLNRTAQKGVVTQEEIQSVMSELDELDGVVDGSLDIQILRNLGEEHNPS